MAASTPKKSCVQSHVREKGKDDNNIRHWISAVMSLCTNNTLCYIILTPLKITNCNASAHVGSTFSGAFCETEFFEDGLVFGDVFRNGMDILVNYIKDKSYPDNKEQILVLNKLLKFMNGDRKISVHGLQKFSGKELTKLVANHLFGKLATSSYYLVDKKISIGPKCDQCFCGDNLCKITGHYGDTSVGNSEVWHGDLDIVISNLAVVHVEDETESADGKSLVEVKLKSALSRNPKIIAQTIVFSFLQKKAHPERDTFLTPCIGIGSSELVVMFYDCEHDVLLESSSIPLFSDPSSLEFSYTAILVSWLVVNYKFLCSGLPDHMTVYKSDFCVHASKKLKIYEENLVFGNVDSYQSIQGKHCPRIKCNPIMHEHERALQELLWSMDRPSGSSNRASDLNPKPP